MLPLLNSPGTELLAVSSGLRPSREGGARVEEEILETGKLIVHDYGAGGTGFQAGMGMAIDAVNLATPELVKIQVRSNI